jgi:hypothetical protein
MLNQLETLKENISSAIDRMPVVFDTHQLILELARENQRSYIRALHESGSDTPFQAVHSAIGKALKQHSLESVTRIRETEADCSSRDIFGEHSTCSRWARLD